MDIEIDSDAEFVMDNDSLFERQVTQEAALLLDGRAAEVEDMKT